MVMEPQEPNYEEIIDPYDDMMRKLVSTFLAQQSSGKEGPNIPAPGSGVGRAVGHMVKGATLGVAGYPRPPETLGESALEFLGSIPTIAAIGAVTSPAGAVAARALRVPQVAMPFASRVIGATGTGGVVGGVQAAAQGEPVIPGALESAALFGGTEAAVAGRGLYKALKTPQVQAPVAPSMPYTPSGPFARPGQVGYPKALGPGPKALPAIGETYEPPVTPMPGRTGPQGALPPAGAVTQPGRVGAQRALPAGAEEDIFASKLKQGQSWEQAIEGTPSVQEPDELLKYLRPAPAKSVNDVPGTPKNPMLSTSRQLDNAIDAASQIPGKRAKPAPAVERAIQNDPRLDIEVDRSLKSPSAFATATDEAAEKLADNPTKLADLFIADPKRYGVSGGVDLENAMEPPSPQSFLGRFKQYADKVVSPLYLNAAGETMKKMGFLWPLRAQRGAFGDVFTTRVLNKMAMTNIQAENFKAQWVDEFFKAMEPLGMSKWKTRLTGIPRDVDEKMYSLLQKIDKNGKYFGEAGIYTDKEIEAGRRLRDVYNRLFGVATKYGMDPDKYINGYAPRIRVRPTGIVREANPSFDEQEFIKMLTPTEATFVHELERTGKLVDVDPTATAGFNSYVSGLANAKMRTPFFDSVEPFVNEHFGVKWVRLQDGRAAVVAKDPVGYHAWRELQHHMLGGVTSTDVNFSYSISKLLENYGMKSDPRALHKIVGGIQSAYYAGAMGSPLGGRPASIIRQLSQIVPTFAELGAKYTMAGVQKALDKTYIQSLRERGMLQSPFEHALERVSMARGAGRAISQVSEAMLKVFSATDQMMRVITAAGSEARFNDFLVRGQISKLPARKEMKEQITRLVNSGAVDEARNQYMMDNIGNLQYVYGKANRPHVLRGALGNMAGMFLSYPLNTMEMYRMFGKRAVRDKEFGPLLRLMGLSTGLMYAGSEFADADLSSAFFLGAVPYSLTFPSIGANLYTAGRTSAEALTKNLFLVGETDYHKKARMDAYRQAARDLRSFVPGGVFMMQDIPALADERTVMNLFALTPKASVQNQLAKERAQQSANNNRLKGYTKIGKE